MTFASGDQAVLEGIGKGGGLVGQHARDQADDAVGQEGGRNLAAADHEVAHGNLAGDQMLSDALVDALVMTAQDDDVFFEGKLIGDALVQDLAVGGHVDDLVVVAFGLEFLDHLEDGLHHHHHAGVAAVAVVIHRQARSEAVLAEVMDMDFHQAFLDGPARDGVTQRTLQKFRYDGENVDAHGVFRFGPANVSIIVEKLLSLSSVCLTFEHHFTMSEEMKPEVLETVIETADVAQETSQEAVEEVKEVVEKAEEEVKEAAEEVKEPVINYGEKTLAELSGLFQELTESEDRMKRSKEAEALKSAFYKRLSREKAEAGEDATVVEPDAETVEEVAEPAGNEAVSPFAAIEAGFKSLYNTYKKERAEYNRQLDAEREDNLAKKQAIIEDLKALLLPVFHGRGPERPAASARDQGRKAGV